MNLYNRVLENVVLPAGDILLRTNFISALKKWRAVQRLSHAELAILQQKKLQDLLTHAVSNIPFYNRQREALCPSGPPEIKRFPIMTKPVLKEHMDNLLWHPGLKHKLIVEKSSGSSGIQGQVYMSRKERSNIQAVQTMLWEWGGYKIGSPMLQTGITPGRGLVKSIKDILFRTRYVSAFSLSESDVLNVLHDLRRRPANFLGGYASSLFLYAKVAAQHGIQDITFESVISWGDKMFPHYRALIERQFNAKVVDTYGTTEGFMIAGQKDNPYYYIVTPHVYVEILDENGSEVKDGEMGYVVVTALDAYEMPLIRYYLGDLAVRLPADQYPAGPALGFPMLERIIGRDTDIVKTPSGKNMIVHFFTGIFEHIPEIAQFRIVQENLSAMKVEYIADKGFHPGILATIEKKIHLHLEENFPVHFQAVDHIPPSPSGKPQIIVSKIK